MSEAIGDLLGAIGLVCAWIVIISLRFEVKKLKERISVLESR